MTSSFDDVVLTSSLAVCALAAMPGGRSLDLTSHGLGRKTLGDLREHLLKSGDGISKALVAALSDRDSATEAFERANATVEQADRDGVRILGCLDRDFPSRLRGIPSAPLVLFVMGEFDPESGGVACVGTRKPSDFGTIVTPRVVREIAIAGRAVISGLASGVDTLAHRACLDAGGYTIAVLAGWPTARDAQPPSNRRLAEEILANGGALVGERMPWERTQPHFFVERNRLQSGLSDVVLMLEAPVSSGTMHTVRHGLAQGRTVATLLPPPGKIESSECSGNRLLSDADPAGLTKALSLGGLSRINVAAMPSGSNVAMVVRGRDDYPALLALVGCPKALLKSEAERFTFFWKGPLSNWSLRDFTIDDVRYCCVEQWMMAEKARLFGDDILLRAILEATSPAAHKSLGRRVRNFDEAVWNANCEEIVLKGVLARFDQNPDLLSILLKTEGTLVEASPYDRVWGIGLSASDPKAQDRRTWNGQNRLGEVLTRARGILESRPRPDEGVFAPGEGRRP